MTFRDTALMRRDWRRRSARVVRHVLIPHSHQRAFGTWVPDTLHLYPNHRIWITLRFGKDAKGLCTCHRVLLRSISRSTSACTRKRDSLLALVNHL